MLRGARFLALIALLPAGCGDDEEEQGQPQPVVKEEVETGSGAPLSSWNTVETGTFSSVPVEKDSYVVVREPVAWNFLHRWVHGTWTEVPPIDFSKDAGVGAFLSQRSTSGYSVSFTGVQWGPSDATCTVQEKVPGPADLVTMVLTRPYALARLTAPVGGIIVVKGGQAPTAAAEKSYTTLVREDYAHRTYASLPIPASGDIAYLESGICPLSKTTSLVAADLGLWVPSTAYYCVLHGKYWVKRNPYAAYGIVWAGPLAPGKY